jgi:hypothetical protein
MIQRKTLRRWNNAIHRDLGYLFFGMTIIYAISGIVLNHFKSGDFTHPDYSKRYYEFRVDPPAGGVVDRSYIDWVLVKADEKNRYKSHVSGKDYLRIFLTNGFIEVNTSTGEAFQEKTTPRYILKEFNLLHYNNIKKFYTWFSDLYAVALITMAMTGLFVLRGKNGIIGRGAWLTAIGILIPALIILLYA